MKKKIVLSSNYFKSILRSKKEKKTSSGVKYFKTQNFFSGLFWCKNDNFRLKIAMLLLQEVGDTQAIRYILPWILKSDSHVSKNCTIASLKAL